MIASGLAGMQEGAGKSVAPGVAIFFGGGTHVRSSRFSVSSPKTELPRQNTLKRELRAKKYGHPRCSPLLLGPHPFATSRLSHRRDDSSIPFVIRIPQDPFVLLSR